MNEIFKCSKVNVVVKDKNTAVELFSDHNLFVDSGRAFIANLMIGAVAMDPTKFVCDFGNDSTTPTFEDVDLISYITGASKDVSTSYPIILAGTSSGIHFLFEYTNTGADQTIKELGLFYRPASDNFPLRGAAYPVDISMVGTILARLKTTFSSIVIGSGRTITIEWKIIF